MQFFSNNRRLIVLLLLTLCCGILSAALPSPAGNWQTIDDKSGKTKSIVNLSISGGQLNGSIKKVYKENMVNKSDYCTKCNGSLKDKPLVGLPIVQGLQRQADGSWSGGTILDPATGKVYKCSITPTVDGKSLKVRGYVGVSMLGRTQTWYKAN